MTKRKGLAAAIAVAAIVAVTLWKTHGAAPAMHATAATESVSTQAASTTRAKADPRTLERASISGTITDEDHAPIAGARVCADASSAHISGELVRDPRCTQSDAAGHYTLGELYAASYTVAALAKPYRPDVFHPDGDRDRTQFALHAGEHKTGVDIVLERGGVEITGIVADISGGPIAHAQVRAATSQWAGADQFPAIETDEHGAFSMYVRPGDILVSAVADGYAPASDTGRAPGKLEILLVPEASLEGTVVDAKTGAPVGGVTVTVGGGEWFGDEASDLSDDAGHFRVTRLTPGRYTATAHAPRGYGHSEGSTLVGLGQHVGGVTVKLHPAVQISGRVVLPGEKRPTCPHGSVWLHSLAPERWASSTREGDGSLHFDGMLPGKYDVLVECTGYQAKDKYAPIVVADKDLTALEWEVEQGSVITGRVLSKTGTPLEHVAIHAASIGGGARDKQSWASDTSQKDGTFRLKGLRHATFKLDVDTEQGVAPKDGWKVEVKTAEVVQDLVLEDVGTIKGTVVDADGKPVAGVHVSARTIDHRPGWGWSTGTVRSGDDGSFTLEGNRAGEYRVYASRGEWGDELRKPGTDDDAKQGERVSVHAGQTASVRVVVESQSGTIRGTCVDAAGNPITDAFVSAARESDAAGNQRSSIGETRWTFDQRPQMTGTDGRFTLGKLSKGNYTVRASRRGGGEAYVEHIAVGASAQLVFKPTASLAGRVHREGKEPEELDIEVKDEHTQFERTEHFFRTAGSYAVHDLPAGSFTITAVAEHGQKQTTVSVGDGEQKTGVDIELDPLVTITGRIIELATHAPVPGIRMYAAAGKSGTSFQWGGGDDEEQLNISDESGHFTIYNAPRGTVTLTGFPKDFGESDFGFLRVIRQIDGATAADVGDVPILKKRVNHGDPVGDLGLHWANLADSTPIDELKLQVSWIDPHGPAAKTELRVGDVVTSVDGIEVTGSGFVNAWTELAAPPGTKIVLGLARGVSVTVTLAPPS